MQEPELEVVYGDFENEEEIEKTELTLAAREILEEELSL